MSDNKDRPDFVPFGDWTYTPWWGGGSEPRMLPSDAMPERVTPEYARRVVLHIAYHGSPAERAALMAILTPLFDKLRPLVDEMIATVKDIEAQDLG